MSTMWTRLRDIAKREVIPPQQGPPAPCHLEQQVHQLSLQLGEREMALLGGIGKSPLFLDTETTGLMGGAGTVAFLVGMGEIVGNTLTISQYYMSDYDQEDDLIQHVCQALERTDLLVTYNGKSFDIPLLRSRFVMQRANVRLLELAHIDLLHGARRVYKRRLHSCSLVDIECQVLDIEREHDLPGKEVPEQWMRYVKTGDQALMDEILLHNHQDILSLAILLDHLCAAYSGPETLTYQQDILSVGKVMRKMGEAQEAIAYFRTAGDGDALLEMAAIYKKQGKYDQAMQALGESIRRRPCVQAMVELAKLAEHQKRDYAQALHWTDAALARCQTDETEALLLRRARVERKRNRKEMSL